MAELKEYGIGTTIYFPLIDRGTVDFEFTPVSFESGDCIIIKNGVSNGNTSNNPVHVSNGIYSLLLTSAEMEAKNIVIAIIDQTLTKEWEDQSILIDTYGNSSSEHAFNLNIATSPFEIWAYGTRGITEKVDLQTATQNSINAIETDTNEIQGKLPTGNIADEDNIETHVTNSLGLYGVSIFDVINDTVNSNVIQISGDSTAANNLELMFDNTGFTASNSTIGTVTNVTEEIGTLTAAQIWSYGTRELTSSETDWTDDEKEQIRKALGILGNTTATTGDGLIDDIIKLIQSKAG